jgi:hypothetical protein
MLTFQQAVGRALSRHLALGWDHRYHQPLPSPESWQTLSPKADAPETLRRTWPTELAFLLPVGVHLTLTVVYPRPAVEHLDPLLRARWQRQMEVLALLWFLDRCLGVSPGHFEGVVVSPGTLRQLVFRLGGYPVFPATAPPLSSDTVGRWRQRVAPWMGPWFVNPSGRGGLTGELTERMRCVEMESLAAFEHQSGLHGMERFPPAAMTLGEWESFLHWLVERAPHEREQIARWVRAWAPFWRQRHPEVWDLPTDEGLEPLRWFARRSLRLRPLWYPWALMTEVLLDLALLFEMQAVRSAREDWTETDGMDCGEFPPEWEIRPLPEAGYIAAVWKHWLAEQCPGLSPFVVYQLVGGSSTYAGKVRGHVPCGAYFDLGADFWRFPGTDAFWVESCLEWWHRQSPPDILGAGWMTRQSFFETCSRRHEQLYRLFARKPATLVAG